MKRLFLAAVASIVLCGCQLPAGTFTYYVTNDGRDAYTYDRDEDGSTVFAAIFDNGKLTVIDCAIVDC